MPRLIGRRNLFYRNFEQEKTVSNQSPLPECLWRNLNSLASSYLGSVASFSGLPHSPTISSRMPSRSRSEHSIVESLMALAIVDLLG